MLRLCYPLVDLLAFNGETLNAPLVKALQNIAVPPDLTEKQARRIRQVFAGERPDHIPFNADLRWWVAERYHDGTLARDIEGYDFEKLLCYSITPAFAKPREEPEPIPGVSEEVRWSGPPVTYKHGGFPGSTRTLRISTPRGTLTAAESYASRSFGVVEHPVKTLADLDIVRHILEQQAAHSHRDVPAGWLAIAPLTPLQMFLVHLAGVQCGAFMLFEAPEAVAALFRFIEEIQRPVIEALARRNRVVLSVENLSAEISGGYWDAYLGPQLAARSAVMRRHGAVYGIHHDGKLQPLFGRLREAGVGYVNGVTAAPSGDVEPTELRRLAGDDLIIQDILPQCLFSPYFPAARFEEYVRGVIAFYRHDRRIIFGIGDLLPVDGEIWRVEFVIRMLEHLTS